MADGLKASLAFWEECIRKLEAIPVESNAQRSAPDKFRVVGGTGISRSKLLKLEPPTLRIVARSVRA